MSPKSPIPPNTQRVLWSAFVALLLFAATLKVPLYHSDAEIETVGRIQYCGFPFPWIQYAQGISMASSLGTAKFWLLPVNLAFWVLASGVVFRLRTLRDFAVCMAIALAVPLLCLLSLTL